MFLATFFDHRFKNFPTPPRLSFALMIMVSFASSQIPSLQASNVLYADSKLTADCPNGNYSVSARNCTGSSGVAFRTLQKAVDVVNAGQTVLVRGGGPSYATTLITRSGSNGNPITVRAYPGEQPLVVGYVWVKSANWIVLDGIQQQNSSGSGFHVDDSKDVIIKNCTARSNAGKGIEFKGSASSGSGLLERLSIINCEVSENGHSGIRGGRDDTDVRQRDILIEGCTISKNLYDGIEISNAEYVVIRGNTIRDQQSEDGIDIKRKSRFIVIEDNVLTNSPQGGIMINSVVSSVSPPIVGGTNVIIRNNFVSNSGVTNLRINSKEHGGYFIIHHNLLVQNNTTADGMYLFRATGVEVYNNTVIGGSRGIVGSCLRSSTIRNNTASQTNSTPLHFQTSSNDCTGYENGLITEDHNNWKSSGDNAIRWTNGKYYTHSQLDLYRSESGQGTGTMAANPNFGNLQTFELSETSPLLNQGQFISGITSVFNGTAPDLGYREFQGEGLGQDGVPSAPTNLKIVETSP